MAQYKKAPTLSDQKRLAIVRTKRKHPGWPMRLIAAEHNVTMSQVRTALEKYDAGQIGTGAGRKRAAQQQRYDAARERVESGDLHATLQEIARDLIAEIQSSPDLAIKEKASLLNQTARSVKTLLDSSIAYNIKNPDAERVWQLAQELQPGISQQELIETWKKISR